MSVDRTNYYLQKRLQNYTDEALVKYAHYIITKVFKYYENDMGIQADKLRKDLNYVFQEANNRGYRNVRELMDKVSNTQNTAK